MISVMVGSCKAAANCVVLETGIDDAGATTNSRHTDTKATSTEDAETEHPIPGLLSGPLAQDGAMYAACMAVTCDRPMWSLHGPLAHHLFQQHMY